MSTGENEDLLTSVVIFGTFGVLFYPFGLTATYCWQKINELMGSKQSLQSLHNKARTSPYPRTKDVIRTNVPDDKVPWKVGYDYKPVQYTSEAVLKGPVWADPDIKPGDKHNIRFNTIDRNVNRKSFICKYDVVDSLPRNPMGRTGLAGRGSLGRWGPNHAADPIVTRWKNKDKRILQFIAVQRKDNGEWAIPGGMVDPGEVVSQTLRREFGEEALNSLEASADDKKHIEESLDKLFHTGKEIYKGYVDDPRNTDNSWMETVAMNFHDENGDSAALFKLNAGDDAMGVQWMDVCQKTKLYASHEHFVKSVAHLHKAEW